MKKNQDKKNNISDEELSLISIISNLENKLEELDHNLSSLPKNISSESISPENNEELYTKIDNLEKQISTINEIISNNKVIDNGDKYLSTMPSRKRINVNNKGYAAADVLRLKRIESIEKKLNDLIKASGGNVANTKQDESFKDVGSSEYVMSSNDRYARSRGIFFGFLFSIVIVFLLIMVSTESYYFVDFFRSLI